LERELQSIWFSLVFYPVDEGDALDKAKENFWNTLEKVNDELGMTPGPWFLGGDAPSLVDIQYIPTVERMIATVLYWKGLVIQGKFPNFDRWLAAWEERPSYIASKSDSYTLIMAIPSQNGPGYASKESKEVAAKIYGLDGAWSLPLLDWSAEPVAPLQWTTGREEASRYEAAYQLIENHVNVVMFASRGAGEPGRPSYHAELADPYAEPNDEYFVPVDVCLRHVTNALLRGTDDKAVISATKDLRGKGGSGELRENWEEYPDDGGGRSYFWNYETGDVTWTPPTKQLDTCLMYLRDRIGVPRDMGQAAAMQLRAHLNWAIEILENK
jgi:glutathione S-transferase